MEKQKNKKWTAGLLVLASLIWGAAFAAQSSGAMKLPAHTFNSLRLLMAAAALGPVVLIMSVRAKKRGRAEICKSEWRESLKAGVLCGFLLLGATFTQQASLASVPAGKAGFLTALYIVLVPVFGSFIGRRPGKRIWFCVFLDTVGFYFLCVHGTFKVESADLLLLLTAACFAVQILVIENALLRGADGVMLSFVQFLLAGLIELPFLLFMDKPSAAAIGSAVPEILYVGVMSGAVGYTLQNIGQKYIASAPAALLMSPESVFSAIFGWLLLGQKLSPAELTGCACVFAAVILSQLPASEKIKKPAFHGI